MFKINIDGKEIKGFKGQTILDVARENNINIPTLCYDERVKIYGGCGLCVVEAEGNPKLLRACATEITPGMVISTNNERIRASRKMTLELLLSDHIGDCRGPCINACPAHTDCQGYVGLIANREYREAVKLIKEKLPLPASLGRVCPHPCETACRRQLVEDPIAIAALKYWVADMDLESDNPYVPEIKPPTGKKVGIVGAGPAGLTAAYFLAQAGHEVIIYDAMPAGGGMLRYGIPEYRLPKAILDKEIKLIEQMGVKFQYNTRIGTDISLEHLIQKNDAVFIGIGAWLSSDMRAKGEDLPGVMGGIDFLREVALHGTVEIGDTVAIVGGGNTAMDAARTAVRLGAEKVMVLYRRTRAEMPAEDIEIIEAEEEGVEFRFLVAPIEILDRGGKAGAIHLQKMQLGEPDSSGRRRPVPIPGEEETIEVDTIISAIGQKVDPRGLEKLGLSKWGSIDVDEDTLVTNIPKVFAGGDGVTGPQIAIDAVAQGGKAAQSIIRYLNGDSIKVKEKYLAEQNNLTEEDFAGYEKIARMQMPHLDPEIRRHNFREVNLEIPEADVVAEANRCLECGCKDYFECRLIKYAGDYEVQPQRIEGDKRQEKLKESHPFIERNSEKCILCGLCVRICDEVMGVTALGLVHRGFESVVAPEFNLPLNQTPCISCGQCVSVCPTGALMEHYPITKNLPLELTETESVCSFCSTGCEPVINSKGSLIVRNVPKKDGLLCRKGRFGFEAFSKDRIDKPMVRRNGKLVEVSFAEAYKMATKTAQSITARYSSSALAVMISPAYTLEEAAAAAGFAKLALKTGNLSSFTRYSARGLAEVMGGKIPVSSFEELNSTNLILAVGSFNRSPIAAVKIRQAVQAGAKLMAISPEDTLFDNLAEVIINLENNTDILKEILAAAITEGLTVNNADKIYGYDNLKTELKSTNPGAESLNIAQAFAGAKKAIIIVDGHEVTQAGTQLLTNLALITGKIGSPRNGIIVVTPGANHLGLWNLGITACGCKQKEALHQGNLKGMFIFGEDPVGAGSLTAEELKLAELLVVVTPFMTATAELADVIFPGSTPVEVDGTYIAADRKVKRVSSVLNPIGGKNNEEIIYGLARAMQVNLNDYKSQAVKDSIETAKQVIDMKQVSTELLLPDSTELFKPAPIQNPALRKFNDKLSREGLI